MRKLKQLPKFKNEQEEASFWQSHDSVAYVNWSNAKRTIFPNLKPTSRSVPLRLTVFLLERLKFLANKKQIPYQSLLKIYLQERVEKELSVK